jgi:hypothetical protein
MERRAVGLAAGRRTRGGSQCPVPRRAAQFANLDKDPMERRAVGLAASRCARGGSRGPVPRRAAQFANLDKDPMERHAVGLAAGRDAGAPTLDCHRCGWRNWLISTRTLWGTARWAWPEDGPQGMPVRDLDPGERRISKISARTCVEPVGTTMAPRPPAASTPTLTPRSGQSVSKCDPPATAAERRRMRSHGLPPPAIPCHPT